MTKQARRPFTKCSSPRPGLNPWKTHILRRTAPQSCPRKWATKGPRQFTGHFAALLLAPACLPACTNCVFRKRQVGGRRVISQTYLCHPHIVHLNVAAHYSFGGLRKAILSNRSNRPKTVSLCTLYTVQCTVLTCHSGHCKCSTSVDTLLHCTQYVHCTQCV